MCMIGGKVLALCGMWGRVLDSSGEGHGHAATDVNLLPCSRNMDDDCFLAALGWLVDKILFLCMFFGGK